MVYYDLDKIKILLYRAPETGDETISIGDTANDQITEDDATQHAVDAQTEVIPQLDFTIGIDEYISYAVNRKATANILYACYQDIVAEDNPRWQYAKMLSKQADKMIEVINKVDDKESLPAVTELTTNPVFTITENRSLVDPEGKQRSID